jgi:putative PIN family toxin of toxin-antitoxin system
VIRAVFDCGIIISGIGWDGNPRRCLDLVYGGQVLLCVTDEILREYGTTVPAVLAAERRRVNVEQELSRLFKLSHFFEPAGLGKQRSRDASDDRYLAAALGAGAEAVVSNDRDLLVLKRPFGIRILNPIEFIKMVRSPGSL